MTNRDNAPAPRTALEAAHRLAAEGKHVHLVADGESICITKECQ